MNYLVKISLRTQLVNSDAIKGDKIDFESI